MSSPGRPLLVGAFVLLTLIWGTTWSAIRVGLEGVPPFTGIAGRFALAAVVLFGIIAWRGVPLGRQRRERWLWLSNAALAFCVSYGTVYWAEQWVPSGLTSVLFATYPVFVALLAHVALPAERLRRLAGAGAVVSFLGVAVIFSEDLTQWGGPRVAVAAVVVLLSPFSSALSTVAVKRWGRGVHPLSLTAVPMALTATVMGMLAGALEWGRPLRLSGRVLAAHLYLALAGTAVTFVLYYWLLSHLAATRLALMAYLIPLVAVSVGVAVFGEPVTPRILVGAAMVLGGVALAVHPGSQGRGSGRALTPG